MTNLNDFKPEKNDKIRFYCGDVFNNAHKNVIEYIKDFNEEELEDFYLLLKGFEDKLYEVFKNDICKSLATLRNSQDKVKKYIGNKDKCYKDTIQFIKDFLISIDDSLILKDAKEIEYDELKPVINVYDKNEYFFKKIYVSRYDRHFEIRKLELCNEILFELNVKNKEFLKNIYLNFRNKYDELLKNYDMDRIYDLIHKNSFFSCRCDRRVNIKSSDFKDNFNFSCVCGCKISLDFSEPNELYSTNKGEI